MTRVVWGTAKCDTCNGSGTTARAAQPPTDLGTRRYESGSDRCQDCDGYGYFSTRSEVRDDYGD